MAAMFRVQSRFLLVVLTALATSMGMTLPASAASPPTVVTAPAAVLPTAEVPGSSHSGVVSAVPAAWTPAVLNGKVLSVTQVGNTMVVGGSFTGVSQTVGGAAQDRQRIVAFDATTGSIRGSFDPSIPSGQVNAVIPGPTANTVYVGGTFPGVNGQSGRVFLLNVNDGSIVSSFQAPGINGQVRDLALSGDKLYVAGLFTQVGGQSHGGLVALNATTGSRLNFLDVTLTENHNWTPGSSNARAAVGSSQIAVDPAGTTLGVIGNFRKADGLERRQMVLIDLTGSTAEVRQDWRTQRYAPACYSWAFDTYMRDISVSPGGEYFVVATTGGGVNGSLCDAVARFDLGAAGDNVQPAWVDWAGGDSVLGVSASDSAVYSGGHQRWANNENGSDFAAAGAIPRPGLQGFDAESGIPLTWNPARHPRGIGAEAITVTESGLWVGSDNEWIGKFEYRRPRLAFFPRQGGYTLGEGDTGRLPSNVYYVGTPAMTQEDVLFRVNAAGPELPALDSGPNWAADEDTDSPWRNSGSNTAPYGPVPSVTSDLRATTPLEVFETERWDPADGEEMTWSIPIDSGDEITVRLYFANRYSGTSSPGDRVFDVVLDGSTVLNDYDIAADAGHDTGTVKEFDITSDGAVDIQLQHVVENPLIDGIEIVMQSDEPTPEPTDPDLQRVWFTGGAVAHGSSTAPSGDIDWATVRGAEMIDGELFYVTSDRTFYRRTFDGTAYGPAIVVDPYNDPRWAGYRTGSGNSTYDGRQPSFYAQISTVNGLAYQDQVMYYTRAGSSALYGRGFSPDSGTMREATEVVPGFDQPNAGEIFFDPAGENLYFSNTANGTLSRIAWADGVAHGSATVVSGPSLDGMNWRSTALFLADGPPPETDNESPTAAISADCTGLECTFDGSGSSDPDGSIVSYEWDFGDGSVGTDVSAEHEFAAAGTYSVSLTVTDDDGASHTASQDVTVELGNVGPTAVINSSCDALECTFDGSGSSDPDGSIVSYEWDFGDGSVGTDVSAEHEFAAAGTYSVSLTVTDDDGASHTASQDVTVEPGNIAPEAAMDVTCTQLVCEFDGSESSDSDGTVESYSWDFGDGTTATGPHASHEFDAAGDYTVSLVVTDDAGASDTASELVTVTQGNQVPEAMMEVACTQLVCEFDGSLSSDPDGLIASYAWDFGDGVSETGPEVSHEFAESGEYLVKLVVTDDEGANGEATTQVVVSSDIAAGEPELVGVAATQAHSSSVSAPIPAQVEDGDTILTFVTASNDGAVSGPDGVGAWNLEEESIDSPMATRLYSRVADGSEAGQSVTISGSSLTKWDVTVVVYRGTAGVPVEILAVDTVRNASSHTSPVVQVTGQDRVGVTYWSDRGGSTNSWTPPEGPTVLSTQAGTGGGRVSSLVVAESAPAGPYGGLVAQTNAPTSRAMSMTLILAPGVSGPPSNQQPEAAIDVSCTMLECEFDGSGSSDPDGTIASYAWEFGDGATSGDVTTSHAFAESGTYPVSLTVTDDDGATGEISTEVVVSDEVPAGEPELVGVSATQGHASSVSVEIPAELEPGDTVFAFLTASNDGAVSGPSGVGAWTLEEESIDSPIATRMFSHAADGSEAGQTVTVSGSSLTKWDLTVVVYRGAAGAPVEVLEVQTERNAASHTSPVVPVSGPDRVALTYWSDRAGATGEWTPPDGPTVLSMQFGSGGGRVSSLLVAESASPGTYGGLVAHANNSSSRAVSMTVILKP